MYTAISRTEKITNIIEKRRPLAEKIAGVESNLQALKLALGRLEENRDRIINQIDDVETVGRLREIDLATLQHKISEESKKLAVLKERFSRQTLNIGVVGLMRQGKSTLLKSLSGLTDNEIPALEGSACTAVRSTIVNHQGETFAEVILHSEDSFLKEVIYPYYEKLGFTNKPSSLNSFATSPFPHIQVGGATDEQIYKHLHDDYYANLSQYRDLLKPGNPRNISINCDQIPEYVMQSRDAQGQLKTFKHLAVKEVKIFCEFQNSDVGNIALIDIPGLGDSKLGDEDLMLNTLGKEVDIVLFIRRPDSLGYQWKPEDTNLYDTAAKALNNLSNRAFMILNHSQKTNNLKACQEMQANLGTMKVIKSEVVDCSNSSESNQIFDLILNYLANNIENIDREYASSYQSEIKNIQSQVNIEIEKMNSIFSKVMQENKAHIIFVTNFDKLWKKLKIGLERLVDELKKERDQENSDFREQVKIVIELCRKDTKIPSLEELENLNYAEKGYGIVYESCLNEIRANLSQHFLSLDEGLKSSLDKVKSQVSQVLIEQGKLGGLIEARGAKFINEIAKLIPNSLIPNQANKIKFGFKMLAEFELSYRGMIQHRIRKNMDVLTPNDPAGMPLPSSPDAKKILQILEASHEKAVYQCEKSLENLLIEPNQAAFAIVEEFLDRILRAEDVEIEWNIFLSGVRSHVWDEFKQIDILAETRQQLLHDIEQVKVYNQVNLVQFLE